jgi:hypothetical protein
MFGISWSMKRFRKKRLEECDVEQLSSFGQQSTY